MSYFLGNNLTYSYISAKEYLSRKINTFENACITTGIINSNRDSVIYKINYIHQPHRFCYYCCELNLKPCRLKNDFGISLTL